MADGWRATTFGEITPKIVIQFSSLHGSPALSLYLSLSLSLSPCPPPFRAYNNNNDNNNNFLIARIWSFFPPKVLINFQSHIKKS